MLLLANHSPVLQILLPLCCALCCGLINNYRFASYLSIMTSLCNLCLSLYVVYYIHEINSHAIIYHFGDFASNIGIEYKLDTINQYIILYINFILFFCITFASKFIQNSCINFISNRKHLFYSMLMFAHTGYLGILSTNDIFNLYVFIEISSLSTYVLVSFGKNKHAVVGAFNYLILGTIGATLILFGIGLILISTGSLNITFIQLASGKIYDIKVLLAGIGFIILGSLLKIAFFPMYNWIINVYSNASAVILIYIAGISTVLGSYILIRFLYFAIDPILLKSIWSVFYNLISILAVASILFCSYIAYLSNNVKKIVIYSIASHISYALMLITLNNESVSGLLYQFIFIDGLNKAAMFLLIASLDEENTDGLINKYKQWYFIIPVILIFNSGIPISGMFFTKLNIISTLLNYNKITYIIVVIISSFLSLLYNYKIVDLLFLNNEKGVYISKPSIGFYILIILQIFITITFCMPNFINLSLTFN